MSESTVPDNVISFLARCPYCRHEFTIRANKEKINARKGQVSCPSCNKKASIEGESSYYLAIIGARQTPKKKPEVTKVPSSAIINKPSNGLFRKMISSVILIASSFILAVISQRLTLTENSWFYDTSILLYVIPIALILMLIISLVDNDESESNYYIYLLWSSLILSTFFAQPFWNSNESIKIKVDQLLTKLVVTSPAYSYTFYPEKSNDPYIVKALELYGDDGVLGFSEETINIMIEGAENNSIESIAHLIVHSRFFEIDTNFIRGIDTESSKYFFYKNKIINLLDKEISKLNRTDQDAEIYLGTLYADANYLDNTIKANELLLKAYNEAPNSKIDFMRMFYLFTNNEREIPENEYYSEVNVREEQGLFWGNKAIINGDVEAALSISYHLSSWDQEYIYFKYILLAARLGDEASIKLIDRIENEEPQIVKLIREEADKISTYNRSNLPFKFYTTSLRDSNDDYVSKAYKIFRTDKDAFISILKEGANNNSIESMVQLAAYYYYQIEDRDLFLENRTLNKNHQGNNENEQVLYANMAKIQLDKEIINDSLNAKTNPKMAYVSEFYLAKLYSMNAILGNKNKAFEIYKKLSGVEYIPAQEKLVFFLLIDDDALMRDDNDNYMAGIELAEKLSRQGSIQAIESLHYFYDGVIKDNTKKYVYGMIYFYLNETNETHKLIDKLKVLHPELTEIARNNAKQFLKTYQLKHKKILRL